MYYSKSVFREHANKKLEDNFIPGGEITDEELKELYKVWLLSQFTTFKEFFNQFCFMTPDEIDETFDIDSRMYDEFTYEEILEYLAKEKQEIGGAMKIGDDLYLVIA